MARIADRLAENAGGEFFVDASCIDCDTCRWLAPSVFARSPREGMSVVAAQPRSDEERERALMALVACPTSSIGTVHKLDPRAAMARFPEPIADGVHYVGDASPDSYGASSYLIVRPSGNVLIDSPRASRPLMDRLAALGGVRFLFLTHRDDVADHAVFRERFGCERILHRADVSADTRGVERLVDGDAPLALDGDLTIIPVPGHTRGSAALLYRDFLFTGDHLAADEERAGELEAWPGVCWYSWAEQTRSMARLRDFAFRRVLPGHGRRFFAATQQEMRAALERLIARMPAQRRR
ncbi:MAG TPA: MBL fold metallo-hydrolase [Polyangia bacterium]|nr:MBL fold metallo-hydrolase [Polyangia bacterium]